MSDALPRLAARSAVAAADLELVRAARTEIAPLVPEIRPTLTERIRTRLLRLARGEADAT